MTTATIELVKREEGLELSVIDKQAPLLVDACTAMEVKDADAFLMADVIYQKLGAWDKRIFDERDPMRASAYETYQRALDLLNTPRACIKEARRIIKQKMDGYSKEQERVRQEEQRKAEAEARARAEQEQIEAALAAEQAGETEVAEQIISEPVAPAPVFVTKATPKTATTFRTQWYAEVTDLKALCRAIADGRQPVALIEPNMPALNKMATALKSTLSIPGVVAKSKTV